MKVALTKEYVFEPSKFGSFVLLKSAPTKKDPDRYNFIADFTSLDRLIHFLVINQLSSNEDSLSLDAFLEAYSIVKKEMLEKIPAELKYEKG